jgi:hypothetical protein
LLLSRKTPKPVERLCIERNLESPGRWASQTDLNGLPFVKKARELFVGKFVPSLGLLAKSPPLRRC